MTLWAFRHYVDANGYSDVRGTFEDGGRELQGKFLSRLRTLANIPIEEWNENYRKVLKGPCAGLEELRFKANKVQQRPLGFVSGPNEFTILFWATEKNNRLVPLSACDRALKRLDEVKADRNRSDVLWLELQ